MMRWLFVVVGALVFGAALFSLLESRWPALAERRWWRRRGHATDLCYWFFNASVGRAVTEAAVVVGVVIVALCLGAPLGKDATRQWIETQPTWVSSLPKPVAVALLIVIADFFGYWIHRALHAHPLWRVHAVHHATRDLDWLSATRNHPLNEIVTRLAQVVPLFAMGFRGKPVAAIAPIFALYAIGLHANVPWTFGPLRYVLASPCFHRWHHSAEARGMNKNFANLLPIWDLIFGTFYMPRGEQPAAFGVPEPVPHTFFGQLAWPFRRTTSARPAVAALTQGE